MNESYVEWLWQIYRGAISPPPTPVVNVGPSAPPSTLYPPYYSSPPIGRVSYSSVSTVTSQNIGEVLQKLCSVLGTMFNGTLVAVLTAKSVVDAQKDIDSFKKHALDLINSYSQYLNPLLKQRLIDMVNAMVQILENYLLNGDLQSLYNAIGRLGIEYYTFTQYMTFPTYESLQQVAGKQQTTQTSRETKTRKQEQTEKGKTEAAGKEHTSFTFTVKLVGTENATVFVKVDEVRQPDGSWLTMMTLTIFDEDNGKTYVVRKLFNRKLTVDEARELASKIASEYLEKVESSGTGSTKPSHSQTSTTSSSTSTGTGGSTPPPKQQIKHFTIDFRITYPGLEYGFDVEADVTEMNGKTTMVIDIVDLQSAQNVMITKVVSGELSREQCRQIAEEEAKKVIAKMIWKDIGLAGKQEIKNTGFGNSWIRVDYDRGIIEVYKGDRLVKTIPLIEKAGSNSYWVTLPAMTAGWKTVLIMVGFSVKNGKIDIEGFYVCPTDLSEAYAADTLGDKDVVKRLGLLPPENPNYGWSWISNNFFVYPFNWGLSRDVFLEMTALFWYKYLREPLPEELREILYKEYPYLKYIGR